MSHFRVNALSKSDLEPAYVLVRTLAPDVSLERWIAFARGLGGQGGVLGLFGDGGVLFGLLTYREDECLRYGRILLVENFIVLELSRESPGRKAMCDAVETIARERNCAAVRLIMGGRGYLDPESVKARGWTTLGHGADQVILTKRLALGCPDVITKSVVEA